MNKEKGRKIYYLGGEYTRKAMSCIHGGLGMGGENKYKKFA